MSNKNVLEKFLNLENGCTNLRDIDDGIYIYKGKTLYTKENIANKSFDLINYATRIAYIKNNILYLNSKKYSRTTSKIQTYLNNLANQKNIL